jgi:hypothetical protein
MNHEAIYNTHPNVVSIDDTAGAMDAQGNPVAIDQAAYDAEVLRLEAEHAAQEYARNRKGEYPNIEELVVALWESVVEERLAPAIELQAKRQAIKNKYPKE